MLSFCSQLKMSLMSRVPGRALLLCHGPDTHQFLQGLTTQNLNRLAVNISESGQGQTASTHAIYTVFLNAPGKILFDAILYAMEENTVCIECDATEIPRFNAHLQRYKLRSQVKIDQESCRDWQVRQVLPGYSSVTSSQHVLMNVVDPRTDMLGNRLLVKNSDSGDQPNSLEKSVDLYTKLRYQLGITEGQKELRSDTFFPQESNMDYLNAIDYRKGCYVGQEMTIRTHHKGVVRKRIVPLQFHSGNIDKPKFENNHDVNVNDETKKSTDFHFSEEQDFGLLTGEPEWNIQAKDSEISVSGRRSATPLKVLATYGNLGLGMLRLDYFGADPASVATPGFLIQSKDGSSKFTAFAQRPGWWPTEKQEERQ